MKVAPDRLVDERPVQRTPSAGGHCHVLLHALHRIDSHVRALVAGAANRSDLVAMQPRVGFDKVTDVGRRAHGRVHQAVTVAASLAPAHRGLPSRHITGWRWTRVDVASRINEDAIMAIHNMLKRS